MNITKLLPICKRQQAYINSTPSIPPEIQLVHKTRGIRMPTLTPHAPGHPTRKHPINPPAPRSYVAPSRPLRYKKTSAKVTLLFARCTHAIGKKQNMLCIPHTACSHSPLCEVALVRSMSICWLEINRVQKAPENAIFGSRLLETLKRPGQKSIFAFLSYMLVTPR